ESGGFNALALLTWPQAVGVLSGLGVVALALAAGARYRPTGEGSWAQTLRAIRAGGSRLATSPRARGAGLLAATIAQAALSAVFALNLLAVNTASIPWA